MSSTDPMRDVFSIRSETMRRISLRPYRFRQKQNTKLSSMNRNQMAQYRRKNIGFIFQTYNLFPVYSVYENILFPLLLNGYKEKDARERVMNIIN